MRFKVKQETWVRYFTLGEGASVVEKKKKSSEKQQQQHRDIKQEDKLDLKKTRRLTKIF